MLASSVRPTSEPPPLPSSSSQSPSSSLPSSLSPHRCTSLSLSLSEQQKANGSSSGSAVRLVLQDWAKDEVDGMRPEPGPEPRRPVLRDVDAAVRGMSVVLLFSGGVGGRLSLA